MKKKKEKNYLWFRHNICISWLKKKKKMVPEWCLLSWKLRKYWLLQGICFSSRHVIEIVFRDLIWATCFSPWREHEEQTDFCRDSTHQDLSRTPRCPEHYGRLHYFSWVDLFFFQLFPKVNDIGASLIADMPERAQSNLVARTVQKLIWGK